MHRVTGKFDTKSFALVISLDAKDNDSKKLYYIIKEYIDNNMFLRVAAEASRLERLRICSIGDHLDKSGEQDIERMDLFITVDIVNKLSKELCQIIEMMSMWAIVVELIEEKKAVKSFAFQVHKSPNEKIEHSRNIL